MIPAGGADMKLDHIAISGETRDAAAAHVQATLGMALRPGGAHRYFGTHNHLLGLAEGLYLEAISIDPAAPVPAYPRWFGLDDFAGAPRLTTWICRTQDLSTLVRDLPEAGEIVALAKTNGDEVITFECDLDECAFLKETTFNFEAHRRTEHYGLIVSQTGVKAPPE